MRALSLQACVPSLTLPSPRPRKRGMSRITRRFCGRTYMISASGRLALTFRATISASSASTTRCSTFPFAFSPIVNRMPLSRLAALIGFPAALPCRSGVLWQEGRSRERTSQSLDQASSCAHCDPFCQGARSRGTPLVVMPDPEPTGTSSKHKLCLFPGVSAIQRTTSRAYFASSGKKSLTTVGTIHHCHCVYAEGLRRCPRASLDAAPPAPATSR